VLAGAPRLIFLNRWLAQGPGLAEPVVVLQAGAEQVAWRVR
jgi:hypothetical protein